MNNVGVVVEFARNMKKTNATVTPSTPIRVAVVEDEVLVARMLVSWLGQDPRFLVVGSASDGLAGWQLCRENRPDVALIDFMMPKLDGLALAERLQQESPAPKIIILSARFDPYCIYRIQQLGLPGYVDKASPPETVTDAILAVTRGETFQTPSYLVSWEQMRNDPQAFFKILSKREIDIIRLLAQGNNLYAIAQELNIAYDTVRTHQRNIRKKLNLHTTVDILIHAKKHGLY